MGEPWYQFGVVPKSISHYFSSRPGRAVPDVAMDGDPNTGMLEGETQTFSDGTYYDTYRIGGTSVSCPLFAGLMALADQRAGHPHGFANPALYALAGKSAFRDIVNPPSIMAVVRSDFDNCENDARRSHLLGAHHEPDRNAANDPGLRRRHRRGLAERRGLPAGAQLPQALASTEQTHRAGPRLAARPCRRSLRTLPRAQRAPSGSCSGSPASTVGRGYRSASEGITPMFPVPAREGKRDVSPGGQGTVGFLFACPP